MCQWALSMGIEISHEKVDEKNVKKRCFVSHHNCKLLPLTKTSVLLMPYLLADSLIDFDIREYNLQTMHSESVSQLAVSCLVFPQLTATGLIVACHQRNSTLLQIQLFNHTCRSVLLPCHLSGSLAPCTLRKLCDDGQSDEHPAHEHDINKVFPQDIIRDRERKEPVRSGRYDRTLD